jgi:phage I-like protein
MTLTDLLPTWTIAAAAVVFLFAFIAALGMWIAVEYEHQRLLRAMDSRRRTGAER